MKKAALIFLLSIISRYVFSQTAFVFDRDTQAPVPDVIAYSQQIPTPVISDETGKIILQGFNEGVIIFRHPGYKELKTTLAEIKANGGKIFLIERIIKIDEVVVSASKWEQDPDELPNDIISVSPEGIAFSHPQTAADMLESTGKIFVQKSQAGGGSPMLRGFGANAVLIVVDGVRMNNAIFRSGNLQNVINVDPNMLEGAEVILGPGSVIYGSDALGGVMDFHTREIDLSTSAHPLQVNAMTRFSSANLEKTGHLDWTLRRKKLGWFGGVTYSKYEDLRAGSNRPAEHPDLGKRDFYVQRINGKDSVVANNNNNLQRPSGFHQLNTLQKIKWQANPQLSLEYIFHLSTTGDIPRYDRLITEAEGKPVQADWHYGPQFWMMNAVKISTRESPLWNEAKLTLARQDFEESRHDRKFDSPWRRSRTENVEVYTLNFDAGKETFLNQEIYYGFEYTYNKVKSTARQQDIDTDEVQPLATRYPNGGSDVNSLAGYFAWKYEVLPLATLNAGVRYSYYRLKASISSENFPFEEIENESSAFNGNVGAVVDVNNNLRFNLLGSTGFRAPNLDDVAKIFDSEPGSVVVPNPDLKPEYSFNLEGGFEWHIGGDVIFRTQVFHSWLRDAMVRSDFTFNGQDSILYDGIMSKVQALTNTGKAIVYGFDAILKWELAEYWGLESYFNFTRGKDLISGESIRHITPAFGNTSLIYKKGKLNVELFSRYNGRIKFDDLPPSEQNKTHLYTDAGSLGWYTLNARAGYKLNKNLSLNVALENILDKHYRTYSSGISAPGINFIASLYAHF